MRALNVLLAILVSLCLGLGIFEFGLGRMPQFREQVRLNQFDGQLGWSKKPNHSGRRITSEFNVLFETNGQGLREPAETPPQPPPETLRVLLLGDSFVLGYTVDEREVFGSQLEQLWRAEGRSIEVINAGTEGYSTDQEALWLVEQGLALSPDLVLIFPYENDIYWNGQETYNGSPKPRFTASGTLEPHELQKPTSQRPWHQEFACGRFLQFLSRQLLSPTLRSTRGFQVPQARARILNEFAPLLLDPPSFLDDCLGRTRGSLAALRDACGAQGVPLVMVPIPSESVVHESERLAFQESDQGLNGLPPEAWSPGRPVELFLSMGRELGIPSFDARAALVAAGQQEVLYYRTEWHLNPAGNRVLAGFLHDSLDAAAMIPSRFAKGSSTPTEAPAAAGGSGVPRRYLVFGVLWLLLGVTFLRTYPDEAALPGFLKVGLMLAFIFTLILGSHSLLERFPSLASRLGLPLVLLLLGFVLYKLGRRFATILELIQAFTLRGHWYLMPLIVVLLSIGSLLVVAASSPLVAPFIYTLF